MSPFSKHQFCPFFTIFALLFFYFFQNANAADAATECYSCASPILRSEWQATGLPLYPPISEVETPTGTTAKNFAFTTTCDKRYDKSTNIIPRTTCTSGICIEMLVLANGFYATVRGCLPDFYPSSKAPSTGKTECFFNMLNQNTTIWDVSRPVPVPQTFVGYSTCLTTSGNDPCNTDLEASSKFAQGIYKKPNQPTDLAWDEKCDKAGAAVQCLSCSRYDMEGTCNWDVRQYCDGRWCTKTIGYVNGRWLEVRGCAPINPLNTQSCIKIEQGNQFSLLSDVFIPRTLSVEHCMCSGQRCNGGMKMVGAMGPKELLMILAISSIFAMFH